jgi:hypothetical protein
LPEGYEGGNKGRQNDGGRGRGDAGQAGPNALSKVIPAIQQRPLFPHREEHLMDLGFGATSKRPFIGWNFGCEPGDFPGLPHWGIILFDRETR